MVLKLSKKEFKEYLCEVIKELSSESLLETVGQTLFDKETVKYVPIADGFEVIEDD